MQDALGLDLANVCSESHNSEVKWYYIILDEDLHESYYKEDISVQLTLIGTVCSFQLHPLVEVDNCG